MNATWLASCACATLIACSSAGTTAGTVAPEAPASEGAEAASEGAEAEVALAGPSDPVLASLLDSVDELLFCLDTIDEHDRWTARESDQRGYGDDEDCEGACGLALPDPGPEPALPEPELVVESIEAIAERASAWAEAPWTTLTSALREAADAAKADLDSEALGVAAVNRAYEALAASVGSGVVDERLCWLAMRLAAADAEGLQSALFAESEEASLNRQVREAMDESDEAEDDEDASDLDDAMDQAAPLVERASVLLRQGPTSAPEASETLEALEASVAPVLGRRTVAAFRAGRESLQVVCGVHAAQ